MSLLNRRGSVLVMVYAVLGVLLVLSGIFVARVVSDRKLFDIGRERQEAFYLAEAAVDEGIEELNNNWATYSGTASAQPLGRGEYEITVSTVSASQRQILADGYVPTKASPRAERHLEAIAKKQTPPSFYDNAIYSAGGLDLKGTSYAVNGDVTYAGSCSGNTSSITGATTNDPTIAPLAQFDWAVLRAIAVTQGNLYDANRIKDVETSKDSYPSDFWFSAPTDPLDPTTGTPNVVYLEGDMTLNGNIGTIGGFLLVVGDVLTDPTDSSDTTINGHGEIDGCVYSTGNFRVNGGGGGLNVDGGVWSGLESRLDGNCTVAFNEFFMDAVEYLVNSNSAGGVVQLLSWRELE